VDKVVDFNGLRYYDLGMKVLTEYPPNYALLNEVFNLEGRKVVFTYGDILYNPSGGNPSMDLLVHEKVHEKQQGDDPGGWWLRYVEDKYFRYNQEMEAYRAQYKFFCKVYKDRNRRALFLRAIASDLSSPIYGGIISLENATKQIQL
jgi:hypothetical protein